MQYCSLRKSTHSKYTLETVETIYAIVFIEACLDLVGAPPPVLNVANI